MPSILRTLIRLLKTIILKIYTLLVKIPKNKIRKTIKKITCLVDYAYPNTRVRAWKSMMVSDEYILGLASAKNLEEYVGLLEHSAYKKEISRITKLDIPSIENLLLLSFINQSIRTLDIAPKYTRKFFEALTLIHEIELLKMVLNRFDDPEALKTDLDYSTYNPVLSLEMKSFLKAVGDAKTKEEAVKLLSNTRYRFISEMPLEDIRKPGYISSTLDRYYFDNLWKSTHTLIGKDADYAKKLINYEVEMMNLMIILRSKIYGFPHERFLIPSEYGINKKLLKSAGKEMKEIVSELSSTQYAEILEEGIKKYEKEKSLLKLELTLRKNLLNEYKKTFKEGSASIGVLLSFLKLKEYELKNVRAIAVAVENGLSHKDIMELVVL